MSDEERYNYIVLDKEGSDWNADTNYANWLIPDHFFTEYRHNDDIYIELVQCNFLAQMEDLGICSTATVYMDGVNLYNQNSTSSLKMLSIVETINIADKSTVPEIESFYVSSSKVSNPLRLKVNKFHSITLAINYGDEPLLDLISPNFPFSFILKVSYKENKKN